jgi:hypothetical protein
VRAPPASNVNLDEWVSCGQGGAGESKAVFEARARVRLKSTTRLGADAHGRGDFGRGRLGGPCSRHEPSVGLLQNRETRLSVLCLAH